MKRRNEKKSRLLFLFVVILLSISGLKAKTVRGIVVNRIIEKPVPGSMVVLIDKKTIYAVTLTDSTGLFSFENVSLDRFNLKVKRFGFAEAFVGPLLISKIDSMSIIVKLDQEDVLMDEVVVQEKRTEDELKSVGYFDRKELGMGKYLSYKELGARQFSFSSDILRTIPGIIIQHGKFGSTGIYSSRASHSGLGQTPQVTIYLDGIQLDSPEIIDMINPNDIAAVEFYNRSTAPSQYYGPAGSLLIWTKR